MIGCPKSFVLIVRAVIILDSPNRDHDRDDDYVSDHDMVSSGVTVYGPRLRFSQRIDSAMETKAFRQLEAEISEAMQRDQHRLRRLLRGLQKSQQMDGFRQQLEKSVAARKRRAESVPKIELNPELPISSRAKEIVEAVQSNQVVIVCGETGSGKSTQLPKICLQAGRGIRGFVGHTQPRRIAARTIAARLHDELKSSVSSAVGFKIRFTDTISPQTFVKLMTDGILLAESRHDRFLDQYDTLIIDEAHERSLNIDFLLGYIKRLLPKRRDLRLIITSATIDAARFAEHFGASGSGAPIIQVSGRSYPVETRFRPLDLEAEEEGYGKSIMAGLDELLAEPPGDVLVFLPTEREIREVARQLRGWSLSQRPRPEILPLYARLSTADQNRVFQTSRKRRIVLATNVAESSLTVPGIRYVIDSGTARISRYSPRSKVQRLPIEPVSRASADQRQGRCGRVAPGICLRLFSEEDYLSREEYATPEIRRTNLAAVILQMLSLRLGHVDDYPFLDPPRPESVRDGFKTLFELGAIDRHRNITRLGTQMSQLPVDPRIARITLAGDTENCLAEILIIATALEIQDPRERPADRQEQADNCHRQFLHEHSDYLSYLKLWDFFLQLKGKLSRNQVQKACRQNFLSFNRFREWQELHRQLRQLVEQAGIKAGPRRDDYDAIHRALLVGSLSNVALKTEKFEYSAAGGAKSFLWPGSGVFSSRPQWVVAAEAIETSKRYLRTVGKVDPKWIEPAAEHLVKRSYSDPHWSRKRGTVMANEKVTLFGLPIVPRRQVGYAKVDAVKTRQLFIEQGLVGDDVELRAEFYRHNRQLISELESMAAKSRAATYFVGDGDQIDFYEERLPDDVHDVATLNRWIKRSASAEVAKLKMVASDIVPEFHPNEAATSAFPDTISSGSLTLSLDYRYQPGDEDDGISVNVPLAAYRQVNADDLEWGVPGLLEEKLVALIRSLPKSIRRCLVPAPDSAKRAAEIMQFGIQPFLSAAATTLSQLAGESIPTSAFDLSKVPHHLRIKVRVVDETGKVVAEGRDAEKLQEELPHAPVEARGTIHDSSWEKEGIVKWDFGELPAAVDIERGGIVVKAFPSLIDHGDSVSLTLSDDAVLARMRSDLGVCRLVCLAEKRELKSHVNWLPRLAEMEVFASTLPYRCDLRSQLQELLAKLAFLQGTDLPRDGAAFEETLVGGRERLPFAIQDIAKLIAPLWENYHRVSVALEGIASGEKWSAARKDLTQQVAGLTSDGFLISTPWNWLQHFPRYFQGMQQRIEKLTDSGHARDAQAMAKIRPLVSAFEERRQIHSDRSVFDPELVEYRWMLEEYRVSLFCQTLGTAIKISPQRLEKQWAKVSY